MLHKVDYEELASIINYHKCYNKPDTCAQPHLPAAIFVDALCKWLAKDNPSFNARKFKEACEGVT